MFANKKITSLGADHLSLVDNTNNNDHQAKQQLAEIVRLNQLTALFQPIMSIQEGHFIGFEGLIRGPADSILHAPANLFAAAKQHKLEWETETACRRQTMSAFTSQCLPSLLFLNVTPETLQHANFKSGETLAYLNQIGLDPARVVIEITENQPIYDFKIMRTALQHYREMGFRIAIDDLGEGFSSLRLWSELRPDFVKIDKHFIQGVDQDSVKKQFLKSIYEIAQESKTEVIAEGVETLAELLAIKDIGIPYCQGYLIARPNSTPPLQPETLIQQACHQIQPIQHTSTSIQTRCTELLARYIEPAHIDQPVSEIKQRFLANEYLLAIPVVKNNRPVGQINRNTLLPNSNIRCAEWMDDTPLIVDKTTSIQELSGYLGTSRVPSFAYGFIISDQGAYLGMGNTQDVFTQLNLALGQATLHSHYLTQLPGQLPIYQKIQSLIQSKQTFILCYADIKNLRFFNENYGYQKGESIILNAAHYLSRSICPVFDFIGHLGDDDFILILQSHDWKERCNRALAHFATHIKSQFPSAENHPTPELNAGACNIRYQKIHSHYPAIDLAREALNLAKQNNKKTIYFLQKELI